MWVAMLLVFTGCVVTSACTATDAAASAASPVNHLIYAAQDDGTLHVYNIDQAHRQIAIFRVFSCCADVRGITAAAPAHRLYIMYNQNNQGRVAAFDLLANQIVWDKVIHTPGVDRGDITPDGKTLYIPTWEYDLHTPYELVVEAANGIEVGQIPLPLKSHDTIVSLDGADVFMETRSPVATMYVASTRHG